MNKGNYKMNESLSSQQWYRNLLIGYEVILTIILVAGYIGNFLNLVIFYRHKAIRPFTRILLLQLTVYDIFGLSLAGIHAEYMMANGGLDFRIGNRLLCQIHGYLSSITLYGSQYTLGTVAIDRFLLIRYPTNPIIKSLNIKHGFLVCISVLIANMLINIAALNPVDLFGYLCVTPLIAEVWYCLIIIFFYAIIPTASTMIPSGMMIYQLNVHNRKLYTNNKQNSLSSHIWAIKMIIITSIYMSITFTGINTAMFLSYAGVFGSFNFLLQTIGYGSWVLLQSNCAVKFYLYNLSTSQFRRNFLKIIFNVNVRNENQISQFSIANTKL